MTIRGTVRRQLLALFSILVLSGILVHAAGPTSVHAQQKSSSAKTPKGPDGLPADIDKMTPAQIEALLAKITDAQARQALLVRLRTAAKERAAAAAKNQSTLHRLETMASSLREKLGEMIAGLRAAPGVAEKALYAMAERRHSTLVSILILIGLLGAFVVGRLAEWFYRRWTRSFVARLAAPLPAEGGGSKAGRAILILMVELLGIGILAGVTYGLFLAFFEINVVGRMIVGAYIAAYIITRLISAVSALFLAPDRPALRLDLISAAAAGFLHRWIVILGGILAFGFMTGMLLRRFGLADAPYVMTGVLVGLITAIAIVIMIWQARARLMAIVASSSGGGLIGGLLLHVWPIAATVYVAVIWFVWSYTGIVHGRWADGVAAFALLLPLIILWLDRYFSRRFDRMAARKKAEAEAEVPREIVLGPEGEAVEETVGRPKTAGVALVRVYRRLTRAFLVIAAVWLLLAVSGVDLFGQLRNSVGATIASMIVDIILISLIFYVIWEIVRISIDSRLSAEGVDEAAATEGEGEGGGAARSRAGTLLPLLKGFLAVTLFVVAGMVILSRLGVNIAPLIAGAGVLGLAIGFGAQTLVRDIVSGVFFLADDAFRLGEYVESGRLRGTVEKISIRSLRLRHHRGMIHTVPYGELKSITNYSRDWVIMKLEFRLPFGTDIEQVRKLIKKIGQRMQDDPTYGQYMLAPLKSQGVSRMDESGLVFRAKFSATPGEQFVIRREAYRMIQETLYENGIQFSNYQVSVVLPEDATLSKEEQEAVNRAAAGGAGAAVSRSRTGGEAGGDDRG